MKMDLCQWKLPGLMILSGNAQKTQDATSYVRPGKPLQTLTNHPDQATNVRIIPNLIFISIIDDLYRPIESHIYATSPLSPMCKEVQGPNQSSATYEPAIFLLLNTF